MNDGEWLDKTIQIAQGIIEDVREASVSATLNLDEVRREEAVEAQKRGIQWSSTQLKSDQPPHSGVITNEPGWNTVFLLGEPSKNDGAARRAWQEAHTREADPDYLENQPRVLNASHNEAETFAHLEGVYTEQRERVRETQLRILSDAYNYTLSEAQELVDKRLTQLGETESMILDPLIAIIADERSKLAETINPVDGVSAFSIEDLNNRYDTKNRKAVAEKLLCQLGGVASLDLSLEDLNSSATGPSAATFVRWKLVDQYPVGTNFNGIQPERSNLYPVSETESLAPHLIPAILIDRFDRGDLDPTTAIELVFDLIQDEYMFPRLNTVWGFLEDSIETQLGLTTESAQVKLLKQENNTVKRLDEITTKLSRIPSEFVIPLNALLHTLGDALSILALYREEDSTE